jgi:DNA invertase Pin-like site-specific DNA recombinase
MEIQRTTSKIHVQHLERTAIIYLRQSSERQLQQNKESQRLQYGLKERAKTLGWHRIEIVDDDLGSSAAVGAPRREGFDRVLASIARGEVGAIFSREVSRLSRTDKDWCQLLELCQLFGTLIGDADQVYDLNLLDDQLILGIKGTMSVVELKVLNMRLIAGMEAKASRGELIKLTAPGYVKEKNSMVKDPDIRVRTAINLIFQKFREIQSVRQTFLWFQSNRVELPVNKRQGDRFKILWQLPTYAFIKDVLQNPTYAGAYVWGRRQTRTEFSDGKVVKRAGMVLMPEECKVFIPNHHEGYIDLEAFYENLKMIRRNSLNLTQEETVSAARSGQGLLCGLLRCGRCGKKFHVHYWGKSGTAARYLCKGDFDAGGKYCLAFGGSTVDRRFSEEILQVVSSRGVKAGLKAIQRLSEQDGKKQRAMELQLQQLEYDANRAFEQYNEVDPRNRLVAAELERRWNEKLEEAERVKSIVEEYSQKRQHISENDEVKIKALAENFSRIWESEDCPAQMKKKIIRTVVEEVIVNLDDSGQTLCFIIHWKGGSHTQFEMEKPKSGVGKKTSLEDIEVIRKMAVRYGDDAIARVLTKLGRRTATGKRWNEHRVYSVRGRYSISGQKRTKPDPTILTLGQAATYCNVSQSVIKRLVDSDILPKEQIVPWAPWEIKLTDLDSDKIQQIIGHLHRTGKLVLKLDTMVRRQKHLFS